MDLAPRLPATPHRQSLMQEVWVWHQWLRCHHCPRGSSHSSRGTGRRISLSCVVDGGVEGKGQYYVLVSQGDGHRLSHGSLKALFPFGSILISEGVV